MNRSSLSLLAFGFGLVGILAALLPSAQPPSPDAVSPARAANSPNAFAPGLQYTEWGTPERPPIFIDGSHAARVVLKSKRDRWFVGEEIEVELLLENRGPLPFPYRTGGDYRGATRATDFRVDAVHESGEVAADPQPDQMCLGGMIEGSRIAPGKSSTEMVPVLDYRRLEKPGRYRVRVSHSLGWYSEGGIPSPVAETTIRVVLPTAADARSLFDDLERREKQPSGERADPALRPAAWRRMTLPVYLPMVAEAARAGSTMALEALGQMPDPDATAVLVGLLDRPDPAFLAEVEQALYLRMPDPELLGEIQRRGVFDSDTGDARRYLRDRSWRPGFADPVRAHARRALARNDDFNLYRGAFFLGCVGTPEDLPALAAAFDLHLAAVQGKPMPTMMYPRDPGSCAELRRAVQVMALRKVPIPAAPKTGSERILFAEAIARRSDFRPVGWEATYAAILRDRLDYVRRVAVECLPLPIPQTLLPLIPGLLRDAHPDVQIAACDLVKKDDPARWKPVLLEVFAKAQDSWLMGSIGSAIRGLCDPLERVELYVSRLGDSEVADDAIGELTMIFHDFGGSSNGAHLGSPEKRKACQQAWRAFVAANRDKLRKAKPFSISDPIPVADLFPGQVLHPRRIGRTESDVHPGTKK